MGAPDALIELVERFDRNKDSYRTGQYNEAQVRREFVDPLFRLLGWDVDNAGGYAEAYKDVIHEDAIKVGGATKAPDYCFRIGGARKFFLEAKKPSVRLSDDIAAAYQLRRYAWSAKLPLSILTDFEEFAVYDSRVKPGKTDKPATARVIYLNYTDYATQWDEIASIFSRDAILKGSFDKYAESARAKKGTAEVDSEFLKEIESWRDALARNLALRNQVLSQRELNFAVQRTIDRLIFLRICEDRGLEGCGRLMALLNGGKAYERLLELFRQADERYNSGLFHFQQEKGRLEPPDTLTPKLSIDDRALKDIIKNLYYPDSPYEFSVLPADILGQVYEQFLGKVIRLTPGHRAVVEDKPEVKKAGGVYYTPTYIVDYIVKHTVGKLLDGKTPKQAARLRILDPACGSGSFLIGAYQYLLDWHRDWYVTDGPEKHRKQIYEGPGGEWRLATSERRRILLNNIYGVDIDAQAVEVTKLSLLLKVLEQETAEAISSNLSMFHERALPDLASNIKCGNSLIGPDFYEREQMSFLDEEEQYRINVFDWNTEFADIMKGGGFDAIIGNPPYIRIQALKEWTPLEVEFYKKRYSAASKGNYDIYVVFVERGLSLLNARGRLGFILPHKFFNAQYGEPLRALLATGRHLAQVVHFGDQQVFAGATTYTCLMFLEKAGSDRVGLLKVRDVAQWRATGHADAGELRSDHLGGREWSFVVGTGQALFARLSEMPVTLREVCTGMFVGQQTSADTVYLFKRFRSGHTTATTEVFSSELGEWVAIESSALKPVVRSGSTRRYVAEPVAVVLFPYKVDVPTARLIGPGEMEGEYPLAWDYLKRNRRVLERRENGAFRDPQWYRFGRNQNLGLWEQPKLLVPYMITRLASYLDEAGDYYFINVTTGGYGITTDGTAGGLAYLCGLLNSRLLDFCLKQVSTTFHGGYFAANKQFIERLPIRAIDFSNPSDKARHDEMAQLVHRMLDLNKRLAATTLPDDKEILQRQIDATDRQIDKLVYELYGLSDEDIRIVESGDA